MTNLVDLATTKAALRIDGSDSDTVLELYIAAASSAVRYYLKRDYIEITVDPDQSPAATVTVFDLTVSPPVITETIQVATIMLIGFFYDGSDGKPGGEFASGELPPPVKALLHPFRDPALA